MMSGALTWAEQLRPNTCGQSMKLKASAAPYRSDAELYNIAVFGNESQLTRELAAKLYVLEKEYSWAMTRLNERLEAAVCR